MTSPSPPRLSVDTREAVLELAKEALRKNGNHDLPSEPRSPLNLLLGACAGMAAEAGDVVNRIPDYMKYLVLKEMGALRPRLATAAQTAVEFTLKTDRKTDMTIPAGFIVQTQDQPAQSFSVISDALIPLLNDANKPVTVWSVPVIHAQRILNRNVGTFDGTPGQTFPLPDVPLAGPVPLEWSADGKKWHDCIQVDVFPPQAQTGTYYRYDAAANAIVLPAAPSLPAGAQLRIPLYFTGGGFSGNVAAGTLTVMPAPLPGITAVTNRSNASGGRDAETVAEAVSRLTITDVTAPRAVTPYEYEKLALQADVGLASAHWVPNDIADAKAQLWAPATPTTAVFTCYGGLPDDGPLSLPRTGTNIQRSTALFGSVKHGGGAGDSWIVNGVTEQSISVQLQKFKGGKSTQDADPEEIRFKFEFPVTRIRGDRQLALRVAFTTLYSMQSDENIVTGSKISRIKDGNIDQVDVNLSGRSLYSGYALLTLTNSQNFSKGDVCEISLAMAPGIKTRFEATATVFFSHVDIDVIRGRQVDARSLPVSESEISLDPPATGSLPVVKAGKLVFKEVASPALQQPDPHDSTFVIASDATSLTVAKEWDKTELLVGPYQWYDTDHTDSPDGSGEWSFVPKQSLSVESVSHFAMGKAAKPSGVTGSHVSLRVVPVCVPDAQGYYRREQFSCSSAVGTALTDFLRPYQIPGVGLILLSPDLKEIGVHAELEVGPHFGADDDDLVLAATKAVNAHLNPGTGVRDVPGWPSGTPVRQGDLYRMLGAVPGVRRVRNATLLQQMKDAGSWYAVKRVDLAAGELPITKRDGMFITVVR